jgi:hypothetical protein
MPAAPKITPEINPLFDKKLLQAFVDGVIKTLATMAQTEAKVGKPYIEPELTEKGEIAGMVGMVAPPLKGTLLISFSKASIFLLNLKTKNSNSGIWNIITIYLSGERYVFIFQHHFTLTQSCFFIAII